MSDVTHISTHYQGRNRILALWPQDAKTHGADGQKTTPYDVASRMESELHSLENRLQNVDGNENLSAKGKREKRIEEQHKTLLVLGGQLKRLDSDANLAEITERREVQEAIGGREKDDVRGVMIDLAVAEQLRSTDPVKLNTSLMTDTLGDAELYAAATLPGILTGLDDGQISRARVNAVYRHNPIAAAANQTAHEARQAGYDALRATYQLVADGVPIEKRKQIDETMFRRFDKSVLTPTGKVPTPAQEDEAA